MSYLKKIEAHKVEAEMTTIFGIFSRDYHSFECAFTKREDAEKYIKSERKSGSRKLLDIVSADLYDSWEDDL